MLSLPSLLSLSLPSLLRLRLRLREEEEEESEEECRRRLDLRFLDFFSLFFLDRLLSFLRLRLSDRDDDRDRDRDPILSLGIRVYVLT